MTVPLILARRNYHVFYYLLLGVNEEERQEFQLKQPEDYFYLNQVNSLDQPQTPPLFPADCLHAAGGQRPSALALSSPQTSYKEAQKRQHKGAHSFPMS